MIGGQDGGRPAADPRFMALAREIQLEVDRIAADADAGSEAIDAAFEGISCRERSRVTREVFDRLAPDAQWAVLERVFDDEALAEALEGERSARLAAARRRDLVDCLVRDDALDTRAVPEGGSLTLGLFREAEVLAGSRLGRSAASCARRLSLVATDRPGRFRVIEDVFNPDGGYFVTADYDEATWRTADRLPAHADVVVGVLDLRDGSTLEPVLHLRGRVDVETDGDHRVGRLHLGFALVDDVEVFTTDRER